MKKPKPFKHIPEINRMKKRKIEIDQKLPDLAHALLK